MSIADHAVPATLSREEQWPPLPLDAWADTRDTLHGVRLLMELFALRRDCAGFWEPTRRLELLACCLQNSCSAN